MEFNSSDYFSYKKNKLKTKSSSKEGQTLSRVTFLLQLFIVTFIIIFIAIAVFIVKFSSRVDIEYSYQDEISKYNPDSAKEQLNYMDSDEEKGKIDKRLSFIQQEENAPSEAKIIKKTDSQEEIIDPAHIENSKKIDKIEKYKSQNAQSEANLIIPTPAPLESKPTNKKIQNETLAQNTQNIIIVSKVLVGKYASFEDAQKAQVEIKKEFPEYSPFIKKTGEIFSVQMGSYQDFSIAKNKAQFLKTKGLDVWIYQQ